MARLHKKFQQPPATHRHLENILSNITIYTNQTCRYCALAKQLLSSKRIVPHEIDVGDYPANLAEMLVRSQRRTVPQVFIGDLHVGGYDDLLQLDRQGKLDAMLQASQPPSGASARPATAT